MRTSDCLIWYIIWELSYIAENWDAIYLIKMHHRRCRWLCRDCVLQEILCLFERRITHLIDDVFLFVQNRTEVFPFFLYCSSLAASYPFFFSGTDWQKLQNWETGSGCYVRHQNSEESNTPLQVQLTLLTTFFLVWIQDADHWSNDADHFYCFQFVLVWNSGGRSLTQRRQSLGTPSSHAQVSLFSENHLICFLSGEHSVFIPKSQGYNRSWEVQR